MHFFHGPRGRLLTTIRTRPIRLRWPSAAEGFETVVHWARSMKTWIIFLDLLYRGHAHVSEIRDYLPVITLTPQGSRLIRPHCGPG